jgi:multidrug efflux system membrane fusion protein
LNIMQKLSRPRRVLLALVGVLVSGALVAVGMGWGLAPDAMGASRAVGGGRTAAAVPVHTALVQREDMPIIQTGIGSARAAMSVTVRSRIDGQLDSVAFAEGQDVAAGQLLASIDDRTYAAQLEQAEAQLARDAAALANAETDLKRYGELVDVQGATQQQLDTAQAEVRQLQAAVRSDAAQVNAAQVQLGFTRITAPIAGRVGARLVDPGNIVHSTDTGGLVVINQIDPIAVQFSLPESNFQAINAALHKQGAKLAVQALDRDTQAVLAEGHLVLLNNQIDVGTGTVELKAMFANPQHRLWPGQSVDARLVLGTHEDALTVPPAAIQRGQSGLFTYVVDAGNKASVREITVGDGDATRVQVTRGLSAGERVVIDGQYRLVPDALISEAQQEPAGNQP